MLLDSLRYDMKIIHGPDSVMVIAYSKRAKRFVREATLLEHDQPDWPNRVIVSRENEQWFSVYKRIWHSEMKIKGDVTNSPLALLARGGA